MRDIVPTDHASADEHENLDTRAARAQRLVRGRRCARTHCTLAPKAHHRTAGPTSLTIPRARIDRVGRAPWYGTNAASDGSVRAVPPPEVGRGTTLGRGTGEGGTGGCRGAVRAVPTASKNRIMGVQIPPPLPKCQKGSISPSIRPAAGQRFRPTG